MPRAIMSIPQLSSLRGVPLRHSAERRPHTHGMNRSPSVSVVDSFQKSLLVRFRLIWIYPVRLGVQKVDYQFVKSHVSPYFYP
jgi:hypothetical protein